MFRRHVVNIIMLAIVCSMAPGCSSPNASWTVVDFEEARSTLEVDDYVRVTDKDGTHHEFQITVVTEHGELVGEDSVLPIENLTLIERLDYVDSVSVGDTVALAVVFTVVGVLFLALGGAVIF